MHGPRLAPRGESTRLFLGPIHAVDNTQRYVAGLVPHPTDSTLLVWVHVWTNRNEFGKPANIFFCEVVDAEEIARWEARGWVNRYLV